MARKLHDAVVKFGTYRNLQRHRAVLSPMAQLSGGDTRRPTFRAMSIESSYALHISLAVDPSEEVWW